MMSWASLAESPYIPSSWEQPCVTFVVIADRVSLLQAAAPQTLPSQSLIGPMIDSSWLVTRLVREPRLKHALASGLLATLSSAELQLLETESLRWTSI